MKTGETQKHRNLLDLAELKVPISYLCGTTAWSKADVAWVHHSSDVTSADLLQEVQALCEHELTSTNSLSGFKFTATTTPTYFIY